MMKKLISAFLIAVSGIATVALTFAAVAFSWFNGPKVELNDEIVNGEIGLRGYFYQGKGTISEPYEIVKPNHYYNFTRLQNLGIFPEKVYFRLGHDFGEPYGICCLNETNGVETKDKFLDLEDLCSDNMILPVGSEGTPFYGNFDGSGLVLKNLTVTGYPEDIGVFGYVALQASVSNLICQNLTINSLGYKNNPSSAKENQLFSPEIDDIFDANVPEISRNMSLTFYEGVGNDKVSHALKHTNGLAGTALTGVNATANLFEDSFIYKGYFEPTYPNISTFNYSWKSSSPLIREVEIDTNGNGEIEENEVYPGIDLEELYLSVDTEDCFNNGEDMCATARLSLCASVTVNNYTYSRVIQSYTIEFYSNSTVYADQGYTAAIFCDYVDTGIPGDHNTNYHHGNNIGLLAGHVDGSFTNSYVYQGNFNFNTGSSSQYARIETESDMALIGEVGSSVQNELDPEVQLQTNGDIGVMNFSKIYRMIRSDMNADTPVTLTAGSAIPAGSNTPVNYVSYDPFKNSSTFDNFAEYLRHDQPSSGPVHYIIPTSSDMGAYTASGYTINTADDIKSDFNAVDFIWNKILQDEPDADRGLGVFKLVTGKCTEYESDPNYGKYVFNGLGKTKIVNGTPKTKVYFSTAELNHTKDNLTSWNPNRGVSLPEYSDPRSFGYPFSRDFNYVFELDLADMDKSAGRNYMWNTDSEYLVNYLRSKLIDKLGNPVTYLSKKFGFMFRSSENEQLDALSSYMPVTTPGNKYAYTVNGETKYYPTSSIAFRIENEFGANVSIVGNGEDITIYSNNPNTSSGGVTALYSMKSSGQSGTDQHRYFTYDVETGATSTEAVINNNMTGDGGALYGHIFTLPQGDYVIGSRTGTANLYFLAVQGQNNASLGDKESAYIGEAIEDIDFLTEEPYSTEEAFPFESYQAGLRFKMVFNSLPGAVEITTESYNTKHYIAINFADAQATRFVTYLFLHSSDSDHIFFINGTRYNTMDLMYRRE